jgi:hypothetical protein
MTLWEPSRAWEIGCAGPCGPRFASRTDGKLWVTLEGKLPGGRSKSCRFDLVETSAVALPLLWAKRRIEFHLAKGETQQAIALAKANNIVCEGTAFIAWDETEKVPVSGREVYQPAMAPAGAGFLSKAYFSARIAPSPAASADDLLCELDAGEVIRASAIPVRRKAMKESLLNRVRRGIMGEPDVAGDLVQNRQKLARDIVFQSIAGQQLLDLLADWIRSHPKETDENLRKLLMLQTKLHQASAKPLAERLEIVRQWILQTLTEETQVKGLEKLRKIEEELQPKAVKT